MKKFRAFPNVVAYNMSKAAVDQLTRTCALEVASQGVRVNAVNPGVIVTEVKFFKYSTSNQNTSKNILCTRIFRCISALDFRMTNMMHF